MPGPSKYYAPNDKAAAKPTRIFFDPWNSSSTGHQRAANRLSGSTSWRDSRAAKLVEQFAAGRGGGKRMADLVGAGSAGFGEDGRQDNGAWTRGSSGLREERQRSIAEYMTHGAQPLPVKKPPGQGERAPKRRKEGPPPPPPLPDAAEANSSNNTASRETCREESRPKEEAEEAAESVGGQGKGVNGKKQLFRNLNFYINGSTYPVISDHKLKRVLVEHGGSLSIGLGRRSVTHVILGTASGAAAKRSAGNNLSGGKMQKEIASVKGAGIKFVGVEWVIQSVKAGQKLPESRFAEFKPAPDGQQSVRQCWEPIKQPG